jgi:hypothetical protein
MNHKTASVRAAGTSEQPPADRRRASTPEYEEQACLFHHKITPSANANLSPRPGVGPNFRPHSRFSPYFTEFSLDTPGNVAREKISLFRLSGRTPDVT